MKQDQLKTAILDFIKSKTNKLISFITTADVVREYGVHDKELIETALIQLSQERMVKIEKSFGGISSIKGATRPGL